MSFTYQTYRTTDVEYTKTHTAMITAASTKKLYLINTYITGPLIIEKGNIPENKKEDTWQNTHES